MCVCVYCACVCCACCVYMYRCVACIFAHVWMDKSICTKLAIQTCVAINTCTNTYMTNIAIAMYEGKAACLHVNLT